MPLTLSLLLAGVAMADQSSLQSCTRIADNMARLACYDTALGVISAAPAPHVKPADAPAPVSQGALSPPAVKTTTEFAEVKKPEEKPKYVGPKQLTGSVDKAVHLAQGLSRITLDNGQVWQTTEAADFETSDHIVISRTLLGHYLISRVGQSNVYSVKRIQ